MSEEKRAELREEREKSNERLSWIGCVGMLVFVAIAGLVIVTSVRECATQTSTVLEHCTCQCGGNHAE